MNRKKDLPAYMTVEVSLLFPSILIVLLCLIYLTFYSYNKTLSFQNAGICALYGKNGFDTKMDNEETVERMYHILETLNEGQYIAPTNLKQRVSIEKNQIIVGQEGNANIPLLNQEIISELDFSEEVKVGSQKNIFYIRQLRKAKKK